MLRACMGALDPRAVTIRPAIPSDLRALVEHNAAMALETEHRELDRAVLTGGVRSVLADPAKGRYLVAIRENPSRIVGSVLVTYEWSDWRNRTFWWIQSVYVPVAERKSGVFRALYRHLFDEAQSRGDVCGLRLYVEQENECAQEVYRSLGMAQSAYRMFEVDFVFGRPGT
jgi:GNAT superfamily N-acetyltransferase